MTTNSLPHKQYKPGDRISYVRKIGGWGYGTVLEVEEEHVICHLDIQPEGETCYFHCANPAFVKGEAPND